MKRIAVLVAVALGISACAGSEEDDAPEPLAANALYAFAIKSAQIKATNNGSNWDPDASGPDVFVTFSDATNEIDSGYIQDSFNPSWNTLNTVTITVAGLRSGAFKVQLWDLDLTVNDPITTPRTVTLTDDQIRSGTVTFTNWDGASSVTFAVAPAVQ